MKQLITLLSIVLLTLGSTAQTKVDPRDFPLKYGQRNNFNVAKVQEVLLPGGGATGNYDDVTRKAVAEYISQNGLSYPKDGSEVNAQLFQTILASNDDSPKATGSMLPSALPTSPSGLKMDFYPDGLPFGTTSNAYVQQVQKSLNMPEHLRTGNFDTQTKLAILKFMSLHRDNRFIKEMPHKDGSILTGDLYNMIVFNTGLDETSSTHKITQSTNAVNRNNDSRYSKNEAEFPLMLGDGDAMRGFNPRVYGHFINPLQSVLKVTITGIIDKETVGAAKKYLTNPKNKEYAEQMLNTNDWSMLNNVSNPGITSRTYNTIINLANDAEKRRMNATSNKELHDINR